MYKFCFLIRMVSEESIQKLIANLKKQSNIDFEQDVQLIVVDVVSTRETEYIQKLKECKCDLFSMPGWFYGRML